MGRILVVDDEEALRHIMGRQLQRTGHEVILAEDGLAAMEILNRESFDVIVSDMKMPRLDGMGLLAQAKELAPGTEFIIITGHGSMENAVEAFKQGNVFDYLLKPLNDIRELSAVVGRAVERRELRSENSYLRRELELQAENQRLLSELQQRVLELEEARQRLVYMAERDGLTGLYNHRTIHARLEALLRHHPQASLSLVIIDMDDFKLLNDLYGHPIGDQALRHLADILRATCGDKAVLGRCGGDEFMIVLPDQNAEQAYDLSQCLMDYLDSHPFCTPEGTTIPLRLCFGIADAQSVDGVYLKLVTAADSALYEGKRSGGNQAVVHFQLLDANDSRGTSAFDILDNLIISIDSKDKYTCEHSLDVTRYALLLAQAIGSSEETANIVRVAGLLHDVGKIGVPDCILRKPGKLTEEEYEIMKQHVTLSSLIIHGLPNLPEILDAVSCHHERWDGRGYPKGLKGEEIPLLGRVMAIADAFSAMTMDRPYRKGKTMEQALHEIALHTGSQFDPELARIFILAMRDYLEAQERLPLAS